ncbi:MAG: hypothetical protein KY392_00780 [Chloroflexi bacterium]|nr:hypothetical protein [Chloroflexota bacterium]
MERLRFRSTSLSDLQAELHERDLLASTERRDRAPVNHRRTVFGIPFGRRRRPSPRRV